MSKKQAITLTNTVRPLVGCHATQAGDYCFCAVTAPSTAGAQEFDGQFTRGAARRQSEDLLDVAERSLKAVGSSLAQGLKIDQFCTEADAAAPYLAVRAQRIATETRPSSTHVQVAGLTQEKSLVGIQLISHASSKEKTPVVVPGMPASPGKPFKPAPHALVHGEFVFVTGQVAYDFDEGYPQAADVDGATWYQSKALNEAKYTLGKIDRIMKHLGGSLADAVKLEIYLNDMSDVVDVERVINEAFGEALPARSYAATVRLAPSRCRVEITAICRRPGSRLPITRIAGDASWSKSWLSPAAVEFGGLMFTSTLTGYIGARLDAAIDLLPEVNALFERAASLHPGRVGGLYDLLFAAVQVAREVPMGNFRAAVEQVPGSSEVVLSTFAMQPPMLWTRGAVQADFVFKV